MGENGVRLWILTLVLSCTPFALGGSRSAGDVPRAAIRGRERVRFSRSEIRAAGGSHEDVRALAETIRALHLAWVSGDAPAYLSRLSPHVTRAPQEVGAILRGPAAVAAALPREWEAFERSGSRLAIRMVVRDAEISVAGDTALARHRIELRGGRRWGFDDEWRVLQAFERRAGRWLLLHETTATGLDSGDARAATTFQFDFVYPVRDLARALAFYRPILGEPESVTANRATFALPGGRFALDARALDGLASVRPGLPNGYAELHVDDLDAQLARLGSDAPVRSDGADRFAVVLDASGNALVLRETGGRFDARAAAPAAPTMEAGADGCTDAVRTFVSAWLRADANALAALHGDDGRLFHDGGARTSRVAHGRAAITEAFRQLLRGYDRSPSGLRAALDVRSVRWVPFGRGALVSYAWTLVGTGPHPVRETALVTQVWRNLDGGAGSIAETFVIRAYPMRAMARALDYTGYPVESLSDAERFYSRTMALGTPYRDEAYRGWWSADAV
ncbi:MAG: DUF4440 domain-containing protein, partial [Deltaproteobacteria bacterium]|nr:DUF4440 domain-containing protein [Deltaproteobacteria bacterium]